MPSYNIIGKKNINGTVDFIYEMDLRDNNEEKLLYTFYRTPERVDALFRNGNFPTTLGIYLSGDELNPNSPLCNEEVMALPLDVGFRKNEFCKKVEFDYYEMQWIKRNLNVEWYKESGVEKIRFFSVLTEEEFFEHAIRNEFSEDDIFLYDEIERKWTVGRAKVDLRRVIIDNEYDYGKTKEENEKMKNKVISKLDAIDNFIANRTLTSREMIFYHSNGSIKITDRSVIFEYLKFLEYAKKQGYDLVNGIAPTKLDENQFISSGPVPKR